METIQISFDTFDKMKHLKTGIVHLHHKQVYKYSPETKDLITAIDSLKDQPVFQHIAIPTAYLYNKKEYFGYVMKYYKKLHQVEEAIKKGIIKDIEKYALELLSIIEESNKKK